MGSAPGAVAGHRVYIQLLQLLLDPYDDLATGVSGDGDRRNRRQAI
jgi:hypothetical protein